MKYFISSLFFMIGFVLFVLSISAFYHARDSRSWPSTVGQVIESGIQRGSASSHTYTPIIHYRYEVDGETYQNDQVYFAAIPWASDHTYADAISQRYVPGAFINVYYHADDHQFSVLQTGVRNETFLGLMVSLVFMGFGALVFYAFHRNEKRRRDDALVSS